MIGYMLAKRYARALLDLAREAKRMEEVDRELASLAEAYAVAPGLASFFADPTAPADAKRKVLEGLLEKIQVGGLTADFTAFLLRKKRILGLPEIAAAYRDLSDEAANRLRARLRSAAPLDPAETERARAALSRLSGKEIILSVEVDPTLLGGMVAQVGSVVYDGSVKNQLRLFAESLQKGR